MLSGVTSSSRSRWPWQQPSTTLRQRVLGPCRTTFYGTRRLPGRGRSSTRCPRDSEVVDVRPQERLQQRTVKQIVDPVPVVPLLHDVEPQMVEQLVDFFAPLDVRVAEQVIEVPQIVLSTTGCSHRSWCAADGRTAGGSADGARVRACCCSSANPWFQGSTGSV